MAAKGAIMYSARTPLALKSVLAVTKTEVAAQRQSIPFFEPLIAEKNVPFNRPS